MNRESETVSVESTPQASEKSSPLSCWFCSAPLKVSDLFCSACGRIQPLSAVDYFNVFGLTRKLNVDTADLERDFYRLSRRLHPDMFARASLQEQDWSLANSSLLNDAYRTLKDPVRRTEYLLKIEGVLSGEDGGDKKEDRVPADLLEEVFDLNMQLDEMRTSREIGKADPQLQGDLLAAKENFDAQFKETDFALRELWKKWDAGVEVDDEAKKSRAKEEMAELLDRRRYIRNLVNSVNEALGI